MSDRYILHGTTPVPEPDLLTWGRWFETAERHVADTWVTPLLRVSTVFLGLDHQGDDGPPLLFETLVFHGETTGDMQRYSTWHEAAHGHQALVHHLHGAFAARGLDDDV